MKSKKESSIFDQSSSENMISNLNSTTKIHTPIRLEYIPTQLSPGLICDVIILLSLGNFFLGHQEDAMSSLHTWLPFIKKHRRNLLPPILYKLIQLHLTQGNLQAAKQLIKNLKHLNEDEYKDKIYRSKALLALALGDSKKALTYLKCYSGSENPLEYLLLTSKALFDQNLAASEQILYNTLEQAEAKGDKGILRQARIEALKVLITLKEWSLFDKFVLLIENEIESYPPDLRAYYFYYKSKRLQLRDEISEVNKSCLSLLMQGYTELSRAEATYPIAKFVLELALSEIDRMPDEEYGKFWLQKSRQTCETYFGLEASPAILIWITLSRQLREANNYGAANDALWHGFEIGKKTHNHNSQLYLALLQEKNELELKRHDIAAAGPLLFKQSLLLKRQYGSLVSPIMTKTNQDLGFLLEKKKLPLAKQMIDTLIKSTKEGKTILQLISRYPKLSLAKTVSY
eukprot:TRINITY_DN2589_c0_g1_i10.p1 TRINITY_DN2589_c0_g1~~TRINITY_DN2589_c0_g1_i10.p1  ORF type:complete len:459 (-),score=60.42 TRINITY_DN2589_c0_g1_i10:110-1486(-)